MNQKWAQKIKTKSFEAPKDAEMVFKLNGSLESQIKTLMAASSLLVNRPFHAPMPQVDYETTAEPFIRHSELAQELTTVGR